MAIYHSFDSQVGMLTPNCTRYKDMPQQGEKGYKEAKRKEACQSAQERNDQRKRQWATNLTASNPTATSSTGQDVGGDADGSEDS